MNLLIENLSVKVGEVKSGKFSVELLSGSNM